MQGYDDDGKMGKAYPNYIYLFIDASIYIYIDTYVYLYIYIHAHICVKRHEHVHAPCFDISALGGSASSGGSKTSVVGGTRHFRLLVEKP